MNKTRTTLITLLLTLTAGVLLVVSLKLPLWRLRMESPQYKDQEALKVNVYPGAMSGDLREINLLNQYIGVHLPKELPQLRWLPAVLVAGATLGLFALALPVPVRRRSLIAIAVLLSLAMLIAAGLAQWQMYDIGHKRDQHTILRGVKDFTPPLLGTVKIENFVVSSRLGPSSYLIAAAIALQFTAAATTRNLLPVCRVCGNKRDSHSTHTSGHAIPIV